MNKRRFLSGLGLAAAVMAGGHLLSSAPAMAAPDTPWESVREAYQRARTHSRDDEVDQALALADGYLSSHPRDGRALTYRGSLAAMRARISWMPWKKLGLLHEGINQMDEGVTLVSKATPGSEQELEVRLVRGITSAIIPSTFGRGGVAFADFKAVVKHPHFAEMAAVHRATALAWLAVMNQRQGQSAESERLQREAEALDAATARKIKEQAA